MLWSVGEAERLKGSPPNIGEIVTVFHYNYTAWLNQGFFIAIFQNMFREDTFYSNENFEFYTLTKEGEGKENFETFS